ncbi:hypothetical protein P350_27795 [Burkholderia cepacia JBK9]|uniref:Uncharacterized protein n=1 Tax=Burkholderia arboris TaxID=488730 RepID=A0A9Q9SH62_9BURK|nr:hypothetical protein [Burkholderia arboris]ALX15278.1 hypothetical protein P350_27795 [Burkholderia cepacia JBK9]MCA8490811.1 hypothetical protein [Burkholderia arboris]UTV56662.1 hypothetical protein NLX30_26450 [Burkholderia arboris]VWB52527.1 hypothetical protein BAR24066_02396 [Burkholderia arboris]
MELRATAVERAALGPGDIERMFSLYAASYCDTGRARFDHDLGDKTHCIVLRDAGGAIQGFSTLKQYDAHWRDAPIRVIFSGDTIIDPAHWGTQHLAFAWIRHAGDVWRQAPAVPLYWFLICKGHRTYRYLRAFARDYAPRAGNLTSPATQDLMDYLAASRYGHAYDPATGILSFDTPMGRLAPTLAEVPAAHRRLADVDYFLARNPGYARGDELVCLCELSASNLRPLARRLFDGT